MLFDSIYTKFKNWQNLSVGLEIRMMVPFGAKGEVVICKGHKGTFWGAGSIQFLAIGGDYTSFNCIYYNSLNFTLMTYALFCTYVIL